MEFKYRKLDIFITPDGGYVGAPMEDAKIRAGDNLVLYGREKALNNLAERKAGVEGEAAEEHKEKQATRTEQTNSILQSPTNLTTPYRSTNYIRHAT